MFEPIHNNWGEIWRLSKDELFSLPPSFFRNKIYEKRLIIIKSVGKLSTEEIYYLMDKFGQPWNKDQYVGSREQHFESNHKDQHYCLTTFDNSDPIKNKKIPNVEMPWHADIPNSKEKPFPHRFLYMNVQPDPNYGKTRWLNIDLDLLKLNCVEESYYRECSVVQQSWWERGQNLQHLPFVKMHPIVKDRESLRLNFYVKENSPGTESAWILYSFHKSNKIPNEQLIGYTIERLYQRKELVYEHTWDVGDMAIYDNWSFVHGRTALIDDTNLLRQFIRGNIDHQTLDEFNSKKFFIL